MSSAEIRDERYTSHYDLGYATPEGELRRRQEVSLQRKVGSSTLAAANVPTARPFSSRDAKVGQEVALIGVDYTPSDVPFDPAIKQRQRADERHYNMLVGARHMLQKALDNPNPNQNQRHKAAKARAKIEKTEKQLVDKGMLPAGYVPIRPID